VKPEDSRESEGGTDQTNDAADPDLLIDFKDVSLRRDGHLLVGPVSW